MLSVFNNYVPLDEVPEFFENVIRTARKQKKLEQPSFWLALPLMLVGTIAEMGAIAKMLPGDRLAEMVAFVAISLGTLAMVFSLGAFLILDPTRHWFDERFKRFREAALKVLGVPYDVLARMGNDELRGTTQNLLQMLASGVKAAERAHPGEEFHPDRVNARKAFEQAFVDARLLGLIHPDLTRHQFYFSRKAK